jgi:pimeloyl-ACP methyl ester carboxylesterase
MTLPSHIAFVIALAASTLAPGPSSGAPRDDVARFAEYRGVYRLSPDHAVGIDAFMTDDGTVTLLFADYDSGLVRRLFPAPHDEFVIGPNFNVSSPTQYTIAFVRGDGGHVTGIAIRPAGAPESIAQRVPLTEKEVVFRSERATLSGTLIVPRGDHPRPAIALLHGSGPLTRRSFGPYPYFFASLGFAVLVYDKRGTGASTGTRLDASTGQLMVSEMYPTGLLDDTAAAFRLLQANRDVDPTKIGLWGSSEGGMLATQAAARIPGIAFAIDSSGFMGPLWQTALYQADAYPRHAGAPEADIEEYVALTRQWLDVARTGQGSDAFVTRREELRKKNKQDLLWSNSASVDEMRWYWDHVLSFNPLPALRNVKAPVLGVFGEVDVSTEAPVAAENLRRTLTEAGNDDVTVKIFPGADHSLSVELGAAMAPGLFETLRSWLLARVEAR